MRRGEPFVTEIVVELTQSKSGEHPKFPPKALKGNSMGNRARPDRLCRFNPFVALQKKQQPS